MKIRSVTAFVLIAAVHATPARGEIASPAVPATATVSVSSGTQSMTSATLPRDIHWVRNSAEYRACVLQTYRHATLEIERRASGLTSGTWAVVLDADETVIDNSQFQKELAEAGSTYTPAAWKSWCLRGDAKPLPGAAGFLERVRELGGRIAIVTNRTTDVQEITERNFREEGIPFDMMLCKTGPSEKEARNESIEKGTALPGVPPLKIVMWLGDNIQDFPGMRQEIRTETDDRYADFGTRCFMLPNPMYGSWERNPAQ